MADLEHIVDQVERSFAGDAWHGPSVLESLTGIDADIASFRGREDGHSIWELALHLVATMEIHAGQIAILKKLSLNERRTE